MPRVFKFLMEPGGCGTIMKEMAKSIYYADSKDLYHWIDKGKAIAARGEGPKVLNGKKNIG